MALTLAWVMTLAVSVTFRPIKSALTMTFADTHYRKRRRMSLAGRTDGGETCYLAKVKIIYDLYCFVFFFALSMSELTFKVAFQL